MDSVTKQIAPTTSLARLLALGALLLAVWLLAACADSAGDAAPPTAAAPQLSAEEYFQQGNAYYEQGDFLAAEAAFSQAAALDGQRVGYWHNLGVTQYSLDRLDEARTSFQQGLKLAPDDAELNYLMGAVSIQLQQLSEAETYLTRANELNPTLPEPYFGLGVLYKLQGKREQAMAAFETFLEIGPGQDPAAIPVAEAELEALRSGE